jgi:hypothetical protein
MRRVLVSTAVVSVGIVAIALLIVLDQGPIAVVVFGLTFLFAVIHGVITWVLWIRAAATHRASKIGTK